MRPTLLHMRDLRVHKPLRETRIQCGSTKVPHMTHTHDPTACHTYDGCNVLAVMVSYCLAFCTQMSANPHKPAESPAETCMLKKLFLTRGAQTKMHMHRL